MQRFIFKVLLIIQFTFFFTTNIAAQIAISPAEQAGLSSLQLNEMGPTHSFQTTAGQNYDLYVSFPNGYIPEGDVEYPVLYLTDASLLFSGFKSTYKALELDQEIQPLILVGIDKPVNSTMDFVVSRILDLTPTKDTIWETRKSQEYGQDVYSGGADNFLEILQSEIIPWIEENFSASDERGLAGYSLGGLFTAHVLLTSPELFQQYLIGSPSLRWDNDLMFEREETFNDKHSDIAAHVYLSAGGEEGMLMERMLRFSQTLKLRNYENLTLEHHVFENETHASAIPVTINQGLVSLYGNQ